MQIITRASIQFGILKSQMEPLLTLSKIRQKEGAHHFSNIFQEPVGFFIQYILEAISKFSQVFTEETNNLLT
jgi:hypothetical protein